LSATDWLYALRVAQPRQVVGRLTRPLRRRRFPAGPQGGFRSLAENEELWRSQAFAALDAHPDPGSRLERFHLSYGEDVLEAARRGDNATALVRAWVAEHPPRSDDAWHPYVASTRVVNWLAAATLDPGLVDAAADSLRLALGRVAANIEDDVLGNHVIRNAIALVLGGVAFGDESLRRRGEALLDRELPVQVLDDGGHYERSPAYHRLVLRDILTVRPFMDVDDYVGRMTAFAAGTSRPDGNPALFNDGGLDIAPQLDLPEPPTGAAVFAETGYVVVREGALWLAFDCGAPSPPFLPAHAHADALSVQIWFDGNPVLVDSGTYTYDPGPVRDSFRGTGAHSTVLVDGRDQFDLWGAFRSGPLPVVELQRASDELIASAEYRGVRHERRVRWNAAHVDIEDSIQGGVRSGGESRLIVAPGADVSVHATGAEEAEAEAGWVSERFAERQQTSVRRAVKSGAGELSWGIDLKPVHKVSS
jgi:Heparinase II/III-like protein/Heparinase II/III N-terminus